MTNKKPLIAAGPLGRETAGGAGPYKSICWDAMIVLTHFLRRWRAGNAEG